MKLIKTSLDSLVVLFFLGCFGFMFFPIFKSWPWGLYFNTDPDIVYLTNVITFYKQLKIYFISHPGGPVIFLMVIVNLPLYLWSLLSGSSFEQWSFDHIDFFVFYNRLVQVLPLILAFIYLLRAKIAKNIFYLSIWGLLALQISIFPSSYWGINNENWSLPLVLIFLGLLLKENTKPFTLAVLAGLISIAKFSNGTVALVLALNFLFKKEKTRKEFVSLSAGLGLGLFLGLIFSLERMTLLWDWIVGLSTHSGAYGTGPKTAFSFEIWKSSLLTIFANSSWATYFCVASVALFVLSAVLKKVNSLKLSLFLSGFLSFLIFVKFGQARYLIAPYLFVVIVGFLCAQDFFAKFEDNLKFKVLRLLLSATLFYSFYQNSAFSYKNYESSLARAEALEKEVAKTEGKTADVWECCRSKDFSYFFVRDWGYGIWEKQMIESKKNLALIVPPYFEKIQLADGKVVNIFDACWDRLFIQNVVVESFLEFHKLKKLRLQAIPGAENSIIYSDHCMNQGEP